MMEQGKKMGSQVDYCQLPSGVSPDGEYNLVDPESLAPTITGISIFLTVWSTIFLAGRFFVNFRKLNAADCEYYYLTSCLHCLLDLG